MEVVGVTLREFSISSARSLQRDGVAAFVTCQQALLSGSPVGWVSRLSVVIRTTYSGRDSIATHLHARAVVRPGKLIQRKSAYSMFPSLFHTAALFKCVQYLTAHKDMYFCKAVGVCLRVYMYGYIHAQRLRGLRRVWSWTDRTMGLWV